MIRALAKSLPNAGAIVATHLNQSMLDHDHTVGTARAVEWRQADAMQLPFADGEFDVVVCQFRAMFFPRKARAFGETRRVLHPGGTFIFNVWDPDRRERTRSHTSSPTPWLGCFPPIRRISPRELRTDSTSGRLSSATSSLARAPSFRRLLPSMPYSLGPERALRARNRPAEQSCAVGVRCRACGGGRDRPCAAIGFNPSSDIRMSASNTQRLWYGGHPLYFNRPPTRLYPSPAHLDNKIFAKNCVVATDPVMLPQIDFG
ncbi:class I SAM-dependent methyltransferase [Paraburkholderia dipogonis]|uniref:Class I SAM-dependent methyltransferase n=1 Tax=Paraburkholderia dipogonis TaxID=1211383 RepID=A0ABW9B7I3_9BURK